MSTSNGQGYADLIDKTRPWWKNTRLIKLNLCILLLFVPFRIPSGCPRELSSLSVHRLITSTTNGYDGSMMSTFPNNVSAL